jgi:hypothetical protein
MVIAITWQVEQVVDDIGTRRGKTEGEEGDGRSQQARRITDTVRGDQWQENE